MAALRCDKRGIAASAATKEEDLRFETYWDDAIAWVAWLGGFWSLSKSLDPKSWSARAYRWLLAGSVVELLVAIPTHLIARRRTECCAGDQTGIGVGIGLVVMVVALGPGVLFLFFRRYREAYTPAGRALKRAKGITELE